MKLKPSAPATQQDIAMLMDQLCRYRAESERQWRNISKRVARMERKRT